MIRLRETIPARALAGLADLAVLEAAVLEAMSASAGGPPETAVFLPEGQAMDKALRRAIIAALPEGTTFAFNSAGRSSQPCPREPRSPSTAPATSVPGCR
jgi:hypothetical protein